MCKIQDVGGEEVDLKEEIFGGMKLPKDNIGRQIYVDKIKYLVETLPKDEHTCLALDGGWGNGKSYVMGMLENEFENRDECIVIYYDAWKNNFYPDQLIAILYCVLDALPKENISNKYLRLINREAKKLATEKITQHAKDAFDRLIEKLYKMGKLSAVCAFSAELIKNVIKQAKSSILDNKLFGNYISYQSLLNESIIALNLLTGQEDGGTERKLIILVDEIDRCLPDDQLVVLERLHHLFNAKNCVVIVALNRAAICNNFKIQYGNDGEEYLRKFFNYNFILESQWDILLRNLFKDFIDKINTLKKDKSVYTEEETAPIISAIIYEFNRIEKICKRRFSSRDISEFFMTFNVIWDKDQTLDLIHIGFILLMLLYKQYLLSEFILYKTGGDQGGSKLKIFKYPENVYITKKFPFILDGNIEFPIYNSQTCNQFSGFINHVIFRKDKTVTGWLQQINSQWFFRLFFWNDESLKAVEQYLQVIDYFENTHISG